MSKDRHSGSPGNTTNPYSATLTKVERGDANNANMDTWREGAVGTNSTLRFVLLVRTQEAEDPGVEGERLEEPHLLNALSGLLTAARTERRQASQSVSNGTRQRRW